MRMSDDPQILKLSARSIVGRMFEELSDGLDEFSLPDITNQVFGRVKADADLLDRLVEECLRPMVYDIGLTVLSSQRAKRSRAAPLRDAIRGSLPAPTPAPAALGDVRATLPSPAPRRAPVRTGFDWLRQPVAVAPRQTIRLRRAVRADLERAIGFAGQGIESTRVSLAYYELIREGLTTDVQTVAERYSDDQLAALWRRAERRVAAEDRVMADLKVRLEARKQEAVAAPQGAS